MASYTAVIRATFARQDREAAQARAYERKHGLERRNAELRLNYLRWKYQHYLPQLLAAHPLTRNGAGRELAKILREVEQLQRRLQRPR